MPGSLVRSIAVSTTVLLAVGCGSNAPEIPEDLRTSSTGSGTEVGQVVENVCFEGWRNPAAVGFTGKLEPICLWDWHDPQGIRGFELVLFNTSALWCQACKLEHRTLGEEVAARAPRGFGLLSLLFQDEKRQPATAEHLSIWTTQYHTDFPMAIDPLFLMGIYAPGDSAPLNMVVDARTMKILQKTTGNEGSVIWANIDSELAARGR
jgi:hypothetical protein